MRGTGEKTRCEERERQGAENGRGVADKDGEISVKLNRGEQMEGWEERDGETLIKICSNSFIIFPSLSFLVYVC